MSKGLEALIRIEDLLDRLLETDIISDYNAGDISIVENELKHHEHNMSTIIPNLVKTNEEQARVIEEQKKELKALEIIKNKEVDVFLLKDTPNLAHYNRHFDYSDYIKLTRQLTQEEYDLLKEVLL